MKKVINTAIEKLYFFCGKYVLTMFLFSIVFSESFKRIQEYFEVFDKQISMIHPFVPESWQRNQKVYRRCFKDYLVEGKPSIRRYYYATTLPSNRSVDHHALEFLIRHHYIPWINLNTYHRTEDAIKRARILIASDCTVHTVEHYGGGAIVVSLPKEGDHKDNEILLKDIPWFGCEVKICCSSVKIQMDLQRLEFLYNALSFIYVDEETLVDLVDIVGSVD